MSDEEEEGFGQNFQEEEEEEDEDFEFDEDEDEDEDGGFGDDFDEEDDEDFENFGGVDEDEDEEEEEPTKNGDEQSGADAPEETPHVWEDYAAANLNEGCANFYEHPGLTKIWTKPVTKITGPIEQAKAVPLYKTLLSFMGDILDKSDTRTVHEKVVVLCTEGINNENMRKELYCQLLKQLHKNASRTSHARGFILLNLYLGSFSPPSDLYACIDEAIEAGPPSFSAFTQERASLIQQHNQSRKFAPLRIELLSVKSRTGVPLRVSTFSSEEDLETLNIPVQSLVTASDLCALAAEDLGLDTTDGFGVRIRTGNSVTSIGEGKHYVLDVLCNLDSMVGEGKWKLEFVKQEFAPWHSDLSGAGLDAATAQIFAAIAQGRYKFDTAEEYVKAVATRYYIEYGEQVLNGKKLQQYITACIPKKMIDGQVKLEKKASVRMKKMVKKISEWVSLVDKTHARLDFTKSSAPKHVAQFQLIDQIRKQWPIFFSSRFAAECISGALSPLNGETNITIAINDKGIFLLLLSATVPTMAFAYDMLDKVQQSPHGYLDIFTKADEAKHIEVAQFTFKLRNPSVMPAVVKLATKFLTQS